MKIIILTINILTNQKLLDRVLIQMHNDFKKTNHLLNNFK